MTKGHSGSAWFGDYGLERAYERAAVRGQRSRTAAGIREVWARECNRPFCDNHHIGPKSGTGILLLWQFTGRCHDHHDAGEGF